MQQRRKQYGEHQVAQRNKQVDLAAADPNTVVISNETDSQGFKMFQRGSLGRVVDAKGIGITLGEGIDGRMDLYRRNGSRCIVAIKTMLGVRSYSDLYREIN